MKTIRHFFALGLLTALFTMPQLNELFEMIFGFLFK